MVLERDLFADTIPATIINQNQGHPINSIGGTLSFGKKMTHAQELDFERI
jgi:hypothetical protein